MSDVAATRGISQNFVTFHEVCDWIPGASTITNLFILIQKACFHCCCHSETIKKNHYFSYVSDKNTFGSIVLLIPFLGQFLLGIYVLLRNRQEKKQLDMKAKLLGLDPTTVPKNLAEKKELIRAKGAEQQQAGIQIALKALDQDILKMNYYIDLFEKQIANPDEPLEIRTMYGTEKFTGPQHQKIEKLWSNLRLAFAVQGLGNAFASLGGLTKEESVKEKYKDIENLKKALIELRRTSYTSHVQTLDESGLLDTARKFYLESFSLDEQKKLKETILLLDLGVIHENLKERVEALAKKEIEIVEMQVIIKRIETASFSSIS